jgi:phosphinothricin acetyltransferase
MSAARIRNHEERDLPELVRIYNHYVTTTHITFDIEALEVEARRPWLDGFSHAGPHQLLVAELEGAVVGYASGRPFRPKPAYDSTVETTIYLDPGGVGGGLGSRLYGALLELLQAERDVHRAVGGVTLPNPGSIALHERFGFTPVGTFREVGFKFDEYWDVCWYEKDVSGERTP